MRFIQWYALLAAELLLTALLLYHVRGGAPASGLAARPPDPPRPAATQPAPAQWQGPFFFVQLSDPQFGMFTKDASFEKETALLEQAVAACNRLKPAFVVITGDLVNKAGHPGQEKELLRILALLDKSIPLHLLAGNHDVENAPTPASLAHYRQVIGKDWYSFDVGGCHFVALNTTIIHKPDAVRDEVATQLTWLRDDLAKASTTSPRHTVAFLHHPLFLAKADEKDNYHVIPQAVRATYLELFKQHGVGAAFAGHLHKNALGQDAGLAMITSGPVGKPLGKDPSGLRIVKVLADRIEHEYFALEAVPEEVDLSPAATSTQPTGALP